jgi:protein transport protein SEC13
MEKSIQTQHTDIIHDSQPDYYGKRLATCSSDRTIKIFEENDDTFIQVAELKGHEAPVWQVSWAHPKFGILLASCSYDRKVIIWKETSKNIWEKAYVYEGHELSVNSCAFAPHEYGLMLCCASSDSTCSVLTYAADKWEVQRFQAHQSGVNSVSWAPPLTLSAFVRGAPSAPVSNMQLVKRFASGGCDNFVKIWQFSPSDNQWKCEDKLAGHKDWVRDVAWSSNLGLATSTLASCGQDKTVIIWTQEDTAKAWEAKALPVFPDMVWRLSWAITGNILAISTGEKVSLWKETLDPEATWKCISTLDDSGASAE